MAAKKLGPPELGFCWCPGIQMTATSLGGGTYCARCGKGFAPNTQSDPGPPDLLTSIGRVTSDPDEQLRLTREWKAARERSAELTAQIRSQMATVRCSCASPADLAEDGRCSWCWGWPEADRG